MSPPDYWFGNRQSGGRRFYRRATDTSGTPEVGESKWALPGARNGLGIRFGRLGVHWVGGFGRYLEGVSAEGAPPAQ